MNVLLDAGDKVNQAQQQIEFLKSMFEAVRANELEFSDFGLSGLTKILRDTLDLLNVADNAISQLLVEERKRLGIQI